MNASAHVCCSDPDAPAPEGAPNDHKSDSEGEISSWSDD